MSDWKLLNTSTASDASSVSFTDLTGYKIFKFVFIDVNPATDGTHFRISASTDGGTSYGVTKTTTLFYAIHDESDSSASLAYSTSADLAQSADPLIIAYGIGNSADQCAAGELHLFNPASTTYVKQFYSRMNVYREDDKTQDLYPAGYFNTTSAINAVKFNMLSGNFDGVIKQYGLVES